MIKRTTKAISNNSFLGLSIKSIIHAMLCAKILITEQIKRRINNIITIPPPTKKKRHLSVSSYTMY